MRTLRIVPLILALAIPVAAAQAQFSLGIGGGTGLGKATDNAAVTAGTHGNVSLEFKPPLLPGVRADAYVLVSPMGEGKFAVALSGVLSAPIPIVTPYLIAGWGRYGLGGDESSDGWNIGVGAKAGLPIGPSVFLEVRRHQRVARDLVTLGIRF